MNAAADISAEFVCLDPSRRGLIEDFLAKRGRCVFLTSPKGGGKSATMFEVGRRIRRGVGGAHGAALWVGIEGGQCSVEWFEHGQPPARCRKFSISALSALLDSGCLDGRQFDAVLVDELVRLNTDRKSLIDVLMRLNHVVERGVSVLVGGTRRLQSVDTDDEGSQFLSRVQPRRLPLLSPEEVQAWLELEYPVSENGTEDRRRRLAQTLWWISGGLPRTARRIQVDLTRQQGVIGAGSRRGHARAVPQGTARPRHQRMA